MIATTYLGLPQIGTKKYSIQSVNPTLWLARTGAWPGMPWILRTDLATFLKVAQHHDSLALELPDHPPKVAYCFSKWCLSGYVGIPQLVALGKQATVNVNMGDLYWGSEDTFTGVLLIYVSTTFMYHLTSTKLALMYSAPVTPVGRRRVRDRLSATWSIIRLEMKSDLGTWHKSSWTYRVHGLHSGSCACCSVAKHQNSQQHWPFCSHCQEAARQAT